MMIGVYNGKPEKITATKLYYKNVWHRVYNANQAATIFNAAREGSQFHSDTMDTYVRLDLQSFTLDGLNWYIPEHLVSRLRKQTEYRITVKQVSYPSDRHLFHVVDLAVERIEGPALLERVLSYWAAITPESEPDIDL